MITPMTLPPPWTPQCHCIFLQNSKMKPMPAGNLVLNSYMYVLLFFTIALHLNLLSHHFLARACLLSNIVDTINHTSKKQQSFHS